MEPSPSIRIDILRQDELDEAERIVRLAFGTFLGLPDPLQFMGDRTFMASRWRASHVQVLAAHDGGRLIGSNVLTRWGSFGFFGPLTILPEYWDRGVAQRLLDATISTFDQWGLRRTGLFTFAHSPKHVSLYQKFGYWPGSLTALLKYTPTEGGARGELLSELTGRQQEEVIRACSTLTGRIDPGLDLGDEIRAVLEQRVGDVVVARRGSGVDAFAICLHGSGSEGGEKTCYVKFAAARPGAGAGERFDHLLDACDAFAHARGVPIEAGMNLARDDAYRRMRAHGYRPMTLGIAMQRPYQSGFNRAKVYVIDDWR